MIKNSIIKNRLNGFITQYNNLKGNAIGFLLLLSIPLLGGCSGARIMNLEPDQGTLHQPAPGTGSTLTPVTTTQPAPGTGSTLTPVTTTQPAPGTGSTPIGWNEEAGQVIAAGAGACVGVICGAVEHCTNNSTKNMDLPERMAKHVQICAHSGANCGVALGGTTICAASLGYYCCGGYVGGVCGCSALAWKKGQFKLEDVPKACGWVKQTVYPWLVKLPGVVCKGKPAVTGSQTDPKKEK